MRKIKPYIIPTSVLVFACALAIGKSAPAALASASKKELPTLEKQSNMGRGWRASVRYINSKIEFTDMQRNEFSKRLGDEIDDRPAIGESVYPKLVFTGPNGETRLAESSGWNIMRIRTLQKQDSSSFLFIFASDHHGGIGVESAVNLYDYNGSALLAVTGPYSEIKAGYVYLLKSQSSEWAIVSVANMLDGPNKQSAAHYSVRALKLAKGSKQVQLPQTTKRYFVHPPIGDLLKGSASRGWKLFGKSGWKLIETIPAQRLD